MKLESGNQIPSIVSEDLREKNFGILANDKMFEILSSKIYSNKIMAPIRELSCNAFDANVEANTNEPIKVHVPSYDEKWFSVEDNGNGMDGHEIEDLYTTYGYSSKTRSNKFIGCLGLGSKSPFAYTDRFSIISRKNGVEYSYQCVIENSMPKLIKFGEEKTDLPSGTKVEFPVDSFDICSFINMCSIFYSNFFPKPSFSSDFSTKEPFKFNDFNLAIDDSLNYTGVLMGNVLYLYDIKDFEYENNEEWRKFKNTFKNIPTILKCDIGDVDIAVSREFVEMTEKSKNFIAKAHMKYFHHVIDEFNKNCSDKNLIQYAKNIYRLANDNKFISNEDVENKISSCSISISDEMEIIIVNNEKIGWYSDKRRVERLKKILRKKFRFSKTMVKGDLRFVYEKSDKLTVSEPMNKWVKDNNDSCIIVFNNEEFKKKLEDLNIEIFSKDSFGKSKKKESIKKDNDYEGFYFCYQDEKKRCGMFFRAISEYDRSEIDENNYEKIYYVKIFNKSIDEKEALRLFDKTKITHPLRFCKHIQDNCKLIGVNSYAYDKIKDNQKYENYIDYLISIFSKDKNEYKEAKRIRNKNWFCHNFSAIVGIKFKDDDLPEELMSVLRDLDKEIEIKDRDLFEDFFYIAEADFDKCEEIKRILTEKYRLLHILSTVYFSKTKQDVMEIQKYIDLIS